MQSGPQPIQTEAPQSMQLQDAATKLLPLALLNGHYHVVRVLFEAGANADQLEGVELTSKNISTIVILMGVGMTYGKGSKFDEDKRLGKFTLLHNAVSKGDTNAVSVLLKASANPNEVRSVDEATPLSLAIANGLREPNVISHYEIAKLLLKAGAEVSPEQVDSLAQMDRQEGRDELVQLHRARAGIDSLAKFSLLSPPASVGLSGPASASPGAPRASEILAFGK